MMTQETTDNKKAASPETAKVKPKTNESKVDEVTTLDVQPFAFLNNKAWLVLLPLALISTMAGTALVFTGINTSNQQKQLEQTQLKFDSYRDGVRDTR